MVYKHAYLILAHTNPNQLRKLIRLLDDKDNDIFVHIDKGARFTSSDFDGCCRESHIEFIEQSLKVNWGGYSIILAELELLKAATKTEHAYYHLISGLDLPIKSNEEIHRFFEQNRGREFVEFCPMNRSDAYRARIFTPFPEGSNFFLTNGVNHWVKGVLKVLKLRRNKDIQFYKGSQWFSITHELAKYVVNRIPWIHKVFHRAIICDELFLQSLVMASPFKDALYKSDVEGMTDNLRLIEWNPEICHRHPKTFDINDFEKLKASPCLWARKFDEQYDNEIIDRVIAMVK